MPNTHANPSDEPPDVAPDWWSQFEAAHALFKATGMWPGANHPTLGQWIVKTCASLKNIQRKNYAAEGARYALTRDQLSALRRAKFPMDGKLPGNATKTKRGGPLARILDAVQKQQSPDPADIDQLAKSNLSLKTEHRLNKLGIKLRPGR